VPAIDDRSTLGELVLKRPAAAALFDRLRLDYCCGGQRTLEQACARRGLDARTVATLLDALTDEPPGIELEAHDVTGATVGELCDHIVARHHDPLRREMRRIEDLLDNVVRVHGRDHRELFDLQRLFAITHRELEHHMDLEEAQLFPACRDRAAERPAGAELLRQLEDDHAATADSLSALREIAGGYRIRTALCATHRALMHALHRFEIEMHRHIHEENNVLFARLRPATR
jgi:regulator of cell morphogenesis and NO signaling